MRCPGASNSRVMRISRSEGSVTVAFLLSAIATSSSLLSPVA